MEWDGESELIVEESRLVSGEEDVDECVDDMG